MEFALLCAGALFAVLSPFATAPAFLAMTEEESAARQMSMAGRACLLAFVLLVLFSLLGERILAAFTVTVPAFQVAGGLVVLRVGFQLMNGERKRLTTSEQNEAFEKDDITVTPLTVPILCGPATFSTGIVLGTKASTYAESITLVVAIATTYAMTFGSLYVAVHSKRLIGPLAIKVMGRLMGMLLAAVAIQFILTGVEAATLDALSRTTIGTH